MAESTNPSSAALPPEPPRNPSIEARPFRTVGPHRDDAPFIALYEAHREKLVRIFLRWAVESAADAVENVFLRVYRIYQESGKLPENPSTYLYDSVRHEVGALEEKRQQAEKNRTTTAPNAPEAVVADGDSVLTPRVSDGVAQDGPGPGTMTVRREEIEKAQAAFETLDELDRKIFELRENDDKSWDEIAALLGLTAAEAKKRYQRATHQMKLIVTQYASSARPLKGSYTWTPKTREGALKAIRGLPPPYAEVIESHYVLGNSLDKLGLLRGVSPSQALNEFQRGEELLREIYGFHLPDDLRELLRKTR